MKFGHHHHQPSFIWMQVTQMIVLIANEPSRKKQDYDPKKQEVTKFLFHIMRKYSN